MKKQPKRLYTRNQGGVDRYYADFRDFGDVGGRQEALIAPGEKRATTDLDVAAVLMAARLRELELARRGRGLSGVSTRTAGLGEFARDHLVKKAAGITKGLITEQWVAVAEMHLRAAVEFFGVDERVSEITVEDVQRFVRYLEEKPTGRRAGKLSPGSQRKYLNSLSNLFARAQTEGIVAPGYNPVASLMEKPVAERREASWLEVPQATLLLESARTYQPRREYAATGALYQLVATFLLTGGREEEVLGLEVDDVGFERKIVRFRPNQWRRLKTKTSHRIVPLWPQLEEVLRPYVFDRRSPLQGLLFPSRRTGGMITDLRKALDAVGERVGFAPGEIRTRVFRHTYCATRLQTLDRGHPVSPWTVARELGHGGRELVDRVYGHLGTEGVRSEVVEYRPEHYFDEMGERIADLRAESVR